jgi:transposase InsO family protein
MFSSPPNTSGAPVNENNSSYLRLPRYLLDSAASITMHPTHTPFRSYRPSRTPVILADQRTTPAIGEGPSTIPTAGRPLRIPRALHVPHLQDHLVSAAQVASHNDILFQGSKVYILQPGLPPEPSQILSTGRRNQGVYELDTRPQQAAFISNITHPFRIPRAYAHLHNTFNHTSARNIRNLIKANPTLRPSIQSPLKSAIETCIPCLEGKQTRAPFRSTDRPSEVLSRVSTDLCGPLPLSSQGARHLQVVIDKTSNYTAGLLLARKDQAPLLLSNLLRSWAITTGRPIKSVLSDNAKELTCKYLQDFYSAQGITPLTTAPYSSSQNGQAERAIRTIQNSIRSALSFSKLPARYWDYAALDAIKKSNVQPSPTTNDTPYNIFHNTTSTSPTHFHPFGQWGYVTNTNPHKSTLAPRALLRRYLMSPNPNHYAVLDPVTSHINMCRSSEFHPINKQTANANRATIPQAVPRTLKQALRLPDAAHWMNAHDKEVDRHVDTLGAWHYERARANYRPIPYTFT